VPKKGPTTSPPAALGETLKARGVKARPRRTGPVWAGPESPEANGGITYSLLCRFLSCRERYRLLVVEGLKTDEGFNHRLEYGNMWHLCEDAFAAGEDWRQALEVYARDLMRKYPLAQEDILKWYNVCRMQFPVYIDYWRQHREATKQISLLQEEVFSVPYHLPSGRVVYLRGKWDGVYLLG
jgi:hypothetical protein